MIIDAGIVAMTAAYKFVIYVLGKFESTTKYFYSKLDYLLRDKFGNRLAKETRQQRNH